MSHLKFNKEVDKALMECGKKLKPMGTCVPGSIVENPHNIQYSTQWRGEKKRRLCVVCGKRRQWGCPTCMNMAICIGCMLCEITLPERQMLGW